MKISGKSKQVLIVGAGPVGMLLALELKLFGIQARVIAKHTRYSPHSKATIVWPGILEWLERTGVSEKLIANAHYFDQMNYYSNKKCIGTLRFDRLKKTPYPFGITIPQWKTEKILEEALKEQGIFIEYGYEFIKGKDIGESVEVSIKDSGDCEVVEQYDWVIGADGFSSRVRDSFGFEFNGFSMKTKLAITDAEIIGEVTSNEIGYYLHRKGNMVLAPLGDGLFRVGASIPEDYDGEIDPAFFNVLLKERVPGNKRLGPHKFCGLFSAHVRCVDRFRQGRVMLAGDAAHVMSPSGAQGLNSGFHDVINLSWKLAGVIHGAFPETILDSYSQERLHGIEYTSNLSTFLANVSLYSNPFAITMRDFAFKVSAKYGLLDSYFSPKISQLNIPIDKAHHSSEVLSVGMRIPLQWANYNCEPKLDIVKSTLLFWPGKYYSFFEWQSFQHAMKQAAYQFCCVNLAGKPLGVLKNFLPDTPLCIVVRPDGYIAKLIDLSDTNYHSVIADINNNLIYQPKKEILL